MRMLGRLLIIALMLLLVALAWYAIDHALSQFDQRDVAPWEDDYERSVTYILEPGETLHFDVPNEAIQLRILHTPVGIPEADEQAELRFEAEPADELSETYQVTIRGNAEPPAENQLPPRFFDSPTGPVAGFTQLHVVSFQQRQKLDEFSLTLTDSTRPLAIRVAVLETYNESVVSRLWQRLNEKQKEQLFEDHIYPVELIPEDERTARLMHRWRPIGPSSSSTGSVDSRALFVNPDAITSDEEERVVDELAVIGPQRWFTLDTRQQPDITRFSCANLAPMSAVEVTVRTVTVAGEVTTQTHGLRSPSQQRALPSTPGLYELVADDRCELTFYNDQGEVIVADYHYLRGTVAQADTPLRYALVDESQQVQPLRLDARLVTSDEVSLPGDLNLRWAVVNKNGEQLLTGDFAAEQGINPYQVAVDASLTSRVHHKSSTYIVAPATAAELRVWPVNSLPAEGVDMLINVYTRPADLPYRVEPTDEDEPQQQQIPKWFLSRPVTRAPEIPPATRLLSWQTPLPEPATDAPADEHWYSLSSLEEAAYFELFLREPPAGRQDTTANLIYSPIDAEGADYQLATAEHDQEVRPQLVYQKAEAAAAPITININGEFLRNDWLYANSGKLLLPSMKQGSYRLSISAPSQVSWFSNYQAAPQQQYRVRGAWRLDKTLRFMVDKKADEEWITFNYFPAIAAAHQVTIRVEKQDRVGVYDDYTVTERNFPIAAQTTTPEVAMLNQDQGPIWQPARLGFLLGHDLDKGRYRITVRSSASGSGYIQAGYLAEPPIYQVDIYTEDGHAPF